MIQLIKMSLRDLGRNPRRSIFSAMALAIGVMMLMLTFGIINGEINGSTESTIRLYSGHLQVRAEDYKENKTSLAWKDLIEDPDLIVAQLSSLAPVRVATPRLFVTGIVSSGKQTIGLRIMGVDPVSEANAPYRDGLVSGEFPTDDDREGILIGVPLAEKLNVQVGDSLLLLINTSNGEISEQSFTVRGTYSTGTTALDKNTILMPLSKAQAITQTENHATIIFVLLEDRDQAPAVAAALQSSPFQIVTWEDMIDFMETFNEYMNIMTFFIYLVMLGMTSVVIVNTLVMSVRERTREIGILSALGMRSRQIMAKFFAETGWIATGGTLVGLVLGGVLTGIFAKHGVYFGDWGMDPGAFLMADRLYASLSVGDVVTIAVISFTVTLLSGFIPAGMAARMEPVAALHGGRQ